ncbi:hypothetical protein PMALA_063400, partial [Plasmodium malariae]
MVINNSQYKTISDVVPHSPHDVSDPQKLPCFQNPSNFFNVSRMGEIVLLLAHDFKRACVKPSLNNKLSLPENPSENSAMTTAIKNSNNNT